MLLPFFINYLFSSKFPFSIYATEYKPGEILTYIASVLVGSATVFLGYRIHKIEQSHNKESLAIQNQLKTQNMLTTELELQKYKITPSIKDINIYIHENLITVSISNLYLNNLTHGEIIVGSTIIHNTNRIKLKPGSKIFVPLTHKQDEIESETLNGTLYSKNINNTLHCFELLSDEIFIDYEFFDVDKLTNETTIIEVEFMYKDLTQKLHHTTQKYRFVFSVNNHITEEGTRVRFSNQLPSLYDNTDILVDQ